MTTHTLSYNEQDLARRAAAFEQAGQLVQAARFYWLASEAAVAGGQYDNARAHLSCALAMTPDSQPEQRYKLLLARIDVLGRLGDHDVQERDLVSLSTLANNMDDDRLRAEVAAALADHKLARGAFQDAITIAQLGARLAEMAVAERELALLAQVWGQALLQQGAYGPAGGKLRSALARAEALGWTQGIADSRRILGVLALEQNNHAAAREQYATALALYKELGDQPGQADVLNNLANVAHAQGDFGAAQGYWEAAKPISEAIGDRAGLCRILVSQSAVTVDVGLYDQAQQHLETALALSQELGMQFGEALANLNLALTHHALGNPSAAKAFGTAALALATAMGSRRLEGYALMTRGKIESDLAAAGDAYWQALALWTELDQPNLVAESRAGLARVALAVDDQPAALAHVEQVLTQLNGGAGIAGTDAPFSIYLTCYRVLQAAGDARAGGILQQANDLLQQRAAAIQDTALRQAFLEQVADHRDLLALMNGAA